MIHNLVGELVGNQKHKTPGIYKVTISYQELRLGRQRENKRIYSRT